MTHHIRRQILELELDREQGADVLQRRASRVLQERVLPELDRLFSQIAPEGRVVRLDRLEVDLGDLDDRNWEQRFVERCVHYVTQKVSEAAFSAEAPADGGPVILNTRQNAWQVLIFFLENGVMPWYARDMTLPDISHALAQAEQDEAPPVLKRLLLEKPYIRQRLIRQFDPPMVESVIEKSCQLAPGWIQHAIQIRQSQTGRPVLPTERIRLLENLISIAQTTAYELLPEPSLVARLFYLETPELPATRRTSPEADADDIRMSSHSAAPETTPERPAISTAPGEQSESSQAPVNAAETADRPIAKPNTGLKDDDKRPAPNRKSPRVFIDGIWVSDAGLVLLAPYFPAFFERLGIRLTLESAAQYLENEAIADTAVLKALHVLHFLASGAENPEEHQLALPKILCGFPVEALIIPDDTEPAEETESDKTAGSAAPILSASDITEALNLLQAVIQNWPALKNTSPEGLQNGFLNRSGLLHWEENRMSWVLRVERQSFDILLDRLPWGYSVIKLPWMQQMIQVEW